MEPIQQEPVATYKGICVVHAYYEQHTSIISKVGSKPVRSKSLNSIPDYHFPLGSADSNQPKEKAHDDVSKDDIMLRKNNILEQSHEIDQMECSMFDFNNFLPDKIRVSRGNGYIRTINRLQYVITCNHIMLKFSKYRGFAQDDGGKVVSFELTVCRRIPEIDIVVMRIVCDQILPELDITTTIPRSFNNQLIVGEYKPDTKTKNVDDIFTTININNNISLIFDILKSKYVEQIPLIEIPIERMDIIIPIIKKYQINLKQRDHPRYNNMLKLIAEKLHGTSGGIIRSDNNNIGMVMIFTNTDRQLSIKALPLSLINMIVTNMIMFNKMGDMMGIQIDTKACDIEYEKEDVYGRFVFKQSGQYSNGKRIFTFNQGDIILEVDGIKFNNNKMLWSDFFNMYVPLNTYLMIRSNSIPNMPIGIKILRQYKDEQRIRQYNLFPIPYNEMHRVVIFNKKLQYWNGLIFIELSEELIDFYQRIGSIKIVCRNDSYSNEKNIILLNYNQLGLNDKSKHLKNISQSEYLLFPCKLADKKSALKSPLKSSLKSALKSSLKSSLKSALKSAGELSDDSEKVFFHTLTHIGQKKITNMEDVENAIDLVKNQKKTNIRLVDLMDRSKVISLQHNN